MVRTWKTAIIFASGLALGAAGAAWLAFGDRDGSSAPPPAAHVSAPASLSEPDLRAPGAAAATSCSFAPAIARSGGEDGQAVLPAKVEGKTASEAARLLVTGKEAAAAGRPRDAEVAFLTACRIAEAQEDDKALAEAKYHLARHYRVVATGGSAGKERDALLDRAAGLYTDALASYRAEHGADHEKTRFAAEGLAQVQQAAGGTTPPVAALPPASPERQAKSASQPAPRQGQGQGQEPQRIAEARAAQEARAATERQRLQARAAEERKVAEERRAAQERRLSEERRAAEERQVAEERRAARERQVAAERRAARERRETDRQAAAERGPARAPASTDAELAPDDQSPAPRQASGSATAGERVRPSFDCSQARSTSEKLICGDAELSRLDRDLGRLHAQARASAADPADFRRRSDREWAEREATCRDPDCLRRWFAERRQELSAEIDEGASPQ